MSINTVLRGYPYYEETLMIFEIIIIYYSFQREQNKSLFYVFYWAVVINA